MTFMPYPSDPPGSDKQAWTVNLENVRNDIFLPLNLRNKMVVYKNKVEKKITWTVYDLDTREFITHEINKPENNGDYSLRHVAELSEGVYLLSIESSKPEYLYLVYDKNNSDGGVVPFDKAKLGENVYELMSLGPWIYAF